MKSEAASPAFYIGYSYIKLQALKRVYWNPGISVHKKSCFNRYPTSIRYSLITVTMVAWKGSVFNSPTSSPSPTKAWGFSSGAVPQLAGSTQRLPPFLKYVWAKAPHAFQSVQVLVHDGLFFFVAGVPGNGCEQLRAAYGLLPHRSPLQPLLPKPCQLCTIHRRTTQILRYYYKDTHDEKEKKTK